MAPKPSGEDELVRRALGGLFEIACEDRPEPVVASLQAQIDELPAERCRGLVEQMVDTDRLATLVEEGLPEEPRRPPRTPRAPDTRSQMVDQALEPLVAWACGEEGTEVLAGLEEEQRLHLLFSSLGPDLGAGPEHPSSR